MMAVVLLRRHRMLTVLWFFMSVLRCSQSFSLPNNNEQKKNPWALQKKDNNVPPPPGNIRLLILPGFGNDAVDYDLLADEKGSLVRSLKARGWTEEQIRVLPVQRSDWLQVFVKGLFDPQFWLGRMPPTRPAFGWYLQRIANAVEEMTLNEPDTQVVLLCHSAGGWLARAALGYGSCRSEEKEADASATASPYALDLDRILGVVTLGSPHVPPPPTVMDMTRGALRITHEAFPGAFHDGLFYVTVIGNAVRGVAQERRSPFQPTTVTGFAFESYQAVCGNGTAVGDGVVPVCAAHLEGNGAQQLELANVLHSINAPNQWYGTDSIVDSWHSVMLTNIRRSLQEKRRSAATNFLQRFL